MNVYTLAADESGDVSFSFQKGASRLFVVAAISTEKPDHLRNFVSDLRKEAGLPEDYEFKFNRLTSTSLRRRVFRALAQQEFESWAVIADKTVLSDTFRVMSGLDVYLYFVSELIQLIPASQREQGTLILDEFGSSARTRTELRRVLKVRNVQPGFQRTHTARSHSEPLLQIADLVAGAIARRDIGERTESYDLLASKMKRVLEYRD